MEKLLANFDKYAKIEKKETEEDKKASFIDNDYKVKTMNYKVKTTGSNYKLSFNGGRLPSNY
jgi:hypothetical protein